MLKEKLEKMKMALLKKDDANHKKTIENLVVFILIVIITIIAINSIWSGDKKDKTSSNETNTGNKKLAEIVGQEDTQEAENNQNIEQNLERILSNINGVGNVKVLVTYSQTSQVVPMYDEDSNESNTEETDKQGGSRKVTENSNKKNIIYKEVNGEKIPITQSVINPKVEGAIVTATGASDIEVKTNIIQAVEAVTGLPTHKIQVFEMKNN